MHPQSAQADFVPFVAAVSNRRFQAAERTQFATNRRFRSKRTLHMIENCPIKKNAEDAARHGGETLKAMRRLRRELQNCPECPEYDDCPVLAEFHATVDQVLEEIYAEWNLT